ncbi:MAG TPA: hypothetical protein VKR56_06830 [Candidatus Cybelea sp.]|nr:hypothetical protein [Candidatus Cybelea sp.]
MTIEIEPARRGIALVMTPLDETEKLAGERSSVVLSVWREGPMVVRGTITHASGSVAHFQGTDTLIHMAQMLGLRLEESD